MKFVIRYTIYIYLIRILFYIFIYFLKKGPDPSPYEFPIFNVSHNPASPYPNPINHLYDKRYKEAYSTFIKQNQPAPSTSQKKEPSTPPLPAPPPPPPPPPTPTTNSNPSPYPTYPQGQFQQQPNKQHVQPPNSRQQPNGGWQYVNPYATMPRSHAAYYQQQAAKLMQPIPEQPSTSNTQHVHRSATGNDLRPHVSRSASSNDLNGVTNSGAEKIRVRVINDNPSSSTTDPQMNTFARQRSILKSNNNDYGNNDIVTTRRIYTSPNNNIGTETMEDLFKVVSNQRSEPTRSTASPMTERIIIIDRRGPNSPDDNQNPSGQDRFRTFEIHSSPGAAPSASSSPLNAITPTTPAASTASPGYVMQQPTYYPGQQVLYQQPKTYASVPNNMYSMTTPYIAAANNFYPYVYYRY
jgi:hypothetical protein